MIIVTNMSHQPRKEKNHVQIFIPKLIYTVSITPNFSAHMGIPTASPARCNDSSKCVTSKDTTFIPACDNQALIRDGMQGNPVVPLSSRDPKGKYKISSQWRNTIGSRLSRWLLLYWNPFAVLRNCMSSKEHLSFTLWKNGPNPSANPCDTQNILLVSQQRPSAVGYRPAALSGDHCCRRPKMRLSRRVLVFEQTKSRFGK